MKQIDEGTVAPVDSVISLSLHGVLLKGAMKRYNWLLQSGESQTESLPRLDTFPRGSATCIGVGSINTSNAATVSDDDRLGSLLNKMIVEPQITHDKGRRRDSDPTTDESCCYESSVPSKGKDFCACDDSTAATSTTDEDSLPLSPLTSSFLNLPGQSSKTQLSNAQIQYYSFGWGDLPVGLASGVSFTPMRQQVSSTCSGPLSLILEGLPYHVVENDASFDQDVGAMEDNDDDMVSLEDITTPSYAPAVKPKKAKRDRVQFSTVDIREYDLVLGDHPWANGFPLSIDWSHTETKHVLVDDFEAERRDQRSGFHTPRRLTASERRFRLKEVSGMSSLSIHDQEQRRRMQAEREGLTNSYIYPPIDSIYIEELIRSRSIYHSPATAPATIEVNGC